MNILFTICGRAGSKGFRNKNLKMINGVPLVYYTLAVIKLYMDRHPDDRIMTALNTDSMELIDMARKQKLLPQIQTVERRKSLAGDLAAKIDVIKDTYQALNKESSFDAVIDLDLTSPIRRAADIENAVREYESDEKYDLVFSVVEARRSPYFNMVEKKDNGFYKKICESSFTARQQAPQAYELNASIYVYRPAFLDQDINKTILEYACGISIMPDYLVLDIDSEEDFHMMEVLHRFYCEKDPGLKEVYDSAKAFVCERRQA